MTGTHSRIVDETLLIWNHLLNYARAQVYDVCRQSYRSRIVASCSFNLEDGKMEGCVLLPAFSFVLCLLA